MYFSLSLSLSIYIYVYIIYIYIWYDPPLRPTSNMPLDASRGDPSNLAGRSPSNNTTQRNGSKHGLGQTKTETQPHPQPQTETETDTQNSMPGNPNTHMSLIVL